MMTTRGYRDPAEITIMERAEARIAGLVDKPLAKREPMLTAEQVARRRAAQAARELREALKEPWDE